MRMQFVLDKRTDKLLEDLASYHGGNRSLVVRQAIQAYSDIEARLDEIETDPAFQAMMSKSASDLKVGRTTSHEEVLRKSRALAKRKSKKR